VGVAGRGEGSGVECEVGQHTRTPEGVQNRVGRGCNVVACPIRVQGICCLCCWRCGRSGSDTHAGGRVGRRG